MSGRWQRGVLRARAADAGAADAGVIKVGGSLLTRPGWPTLLAELLQQQTATGQRCLLVVGGGAVIEGLRTIDTAAPQPPSVMHRLAIELMGATARLVAEALALPLVTMPGGQLACVLDVASWLGREDRSQQLPAGWHVTSDSIAAFIAAHTATGNGCELLLTKNVPPPAGGSAQETLEPLSHSGWVDAYFPTAAAPLAQISWACPLSVPPPAG